jgi:hypothetical protein
MMAVPLGRNHLLERAGKFFGVRDVVSKLPDKSMHRTSSVHVYARAQIPQQQAARRFQGMDFEDAVLKPGQRGLAGAA